MADPSPNITIPISPGEVVDRLTILEIKSQRITDAAKRANVHVELASLAKAAKGAIPDTDEMRGLHAELKAINEKLWVIEDDIRDLERKGDFGAAFIALAWRGPSTAPTTSAPASSVGSTRPSAPT